MQFCDNPKEAIGLIDSLPDINRLSLAYLIRFLQVLYSLLCPCLEFLRRLLKLLTWKVLNMSLAGDSLLFTITTGRVLCAPTP